MANMTTLQILQGIHDWVLNEIDEQTADFITNTVDNLVNYYKKSETYTKSEVQQIVDTIKQFIYEVVQVLPTASESTMNKIYLVPAPKSEDKNIKEEYITIRSGSAGSYTYSWELLGTTSIDLSNYYTKGETDSAISAALTSALQDYTTTDDLMALLDTKANIDGFYETMGVGTAMNLVGKTENTNNSMYRKTGGAEEATDGTATLKNIKGNTVAWNQMVFQSVSIGSFVNKWTTFDNYTTLTANERELQILKSDGYGIAIYRLADGTIVSNHVYYLCAKIKTTAPAKMIQITAYGVDTIIDAGRTQTETTDWQSICSIRRCATASGQQYRITDLRNSNFDTVYAKDFAFIDLTLIYGAGNEPSTVAQFEADYERWFGKPLTYEEYDAGSLRSVQLDAIKTTGFNQYNNGSAKVIGGLQYQITGTYTSISLGEESITPDANGLFTPSTTGTLTIVGGGGDTCVHISGDRNGEYEPYEEHVASVPTTTLTGKLNGEGESVTIFADGMKSAGTIADEIYSAGNKTNATQRLGVVNLGDLNYARAVFDGVPFFWATVVNAKKALTYDAINARYEIYKSYADIANYDKIIVPYGVTGQYARIAIRDNAYTDAATLKTTLNGVMLYYELETPLVYEVEGFTLPKPYVVDGGGTEEQVQKQGVQGVASTLTCSYGMDAVKTLMNLPQRFVSASEEQNFSESQKALARRNIGVEEILARKANQEGVYEGLTVGLADNLRGDNVVGAEFYRRKSGGTQSVTSGIAAIKEVKGKSIVWNQLVENGNFSQGVSNWAAQMGVTTDVNDEVLSFVPTNEWGGVETINPIFSISGHKYLVHLLCRNTTENDIEAILANKAYSSAVNTPNYVSISTSNDFVKTSSISTCSESGNIGLRIRTKNNTSENAIYIKNVQFFDLTLMFGAGNEPATVEEFEKMFPLDYYDYNAGEVIPFAGENLVTTGFNQWDEEWELGGLNADTGAKDSTTNKIRTKNYVRVFPSTVYFINNHFINVCYYDINHTFISTETHSSGGHTYTTPANAAYILAATSSAYGTIYNHDICINISDENKNYTYEPYEKHTLPLDPSQWRDKNGDLVFPYGGMHGVGTAFDYAKVDADGYIRKAVRVFGSVDLGSLSWGSNSFGTEHLVFYALIADAAYSTYGFKSHTLQAKYNQSYVTIAASLLSNKQLSTNTNGGYVYVRDDSYPSEDTFKAANQGVMLYYELAEPVEVELATPVYANYYVNGGGTEAIEPDNGTAPYTTPANLSILYAMDARGEINNLPKNYLSKESAENMLGAMQTAGIIGGYTMTFDSATNRYVFAITAPTAPNE